MWKPQTTMYANAQIKRHRAGCREVVDLMQALMRPLLFPNITIHPPVANNMSQRQT
jgi:hypothetical protein